MIENNSSMKLKTSRDVFETSTWKNNLILALERKLQMSKHIELGNNKLQNISDLLSTYVIENQH
jgi:hypothetical protein